MQPGQPRWGARLRLCRSLYRCSDGCPAVGADGHSGYHRSALVENHNAMFTPRRNEQRDGPPGRRIDMTATDSTDAALAVGRVEFLDRAPAFGDVADELGIGCLGSVGVEARCSALNAFLTLAGAFSPPHHPNRRGMPARPEPSSSPAARVADPQVVPLVDAADRLAHQPASGRRPVPRASSVRSGRQTSRRTRRERARSRSLRFAIPDSLSEAARTPPGRRSVRPRRGGPVHARAGQSR